MSAAPAPASSPPLVTVVIAVYNDAARLGRALDSVLAQTMRDWECVVVDDHSSDAVPRVVRRYARADRRIRGLRLAANRGAAVARDAALAAARGTWVAILDADDSWDSDKLAVQLAALAARPEAVWSCHGVRLCGPDGPFGERLPAATGCLERLFAEDDAVIHSTVIVRRDVLSRLGGYDRRWRRSQDWDLFLKLAAGWGEAGLVVLPRVLASYEVRGGFLSPAAVALQRRNQARILARRMAPAVLLRRPTLAWRAWDGYVDRVVAWSERLGERPRATAWAAAAVALAPWRRWRWRRLWRVLTENDRPTGSR